MTRMRNHTNTGAGVGEPASQGTVSRRGRTLLIAIILILLLSLCAVAALLLRMAQPTPGAVADTEEAGGIEWVSSIYGWGAAEDQLLIRPKKVEVGEGGVIYVTDTFYSSVFKFSPEGTLVEELAEESDPPLVGVGAVAEGEGQLFLGRTDRDKVHVMTMDGLEESTFDFPSPNDIEHSGDRLAVASNWGFVVFDGTGQFLWEVGGTRGDGDDEFDVISGLAYGPDGTLYVADTYNNRISAYDQDGALLWMQRTGDPGKGVDITDPAAAASQETSAPAALQMPVDLVADGNGRIVVVDAMDFSIAVFDAKDGTFIDKYGAYGNRDGQLAYPSSIDYDPERDWFVVSDSANRRVQILRIPGSAAAAEAAIGTVRRATAGPLRACLFPLLVFLVMILAWSWLNRRRRHADSVGSTDLSDCGEEEVGS